MHRRFGERRGGTCRRVRHGCDQFDLMGPAAGRRRGRYRPYPLWQQFCLVCPGTNSLRSEGRGCGLHGSECRSGAIAKGAPKVIFFKTPALQQPIPFNADLVIHSATKFTDGHGDLIAGVVPGPKESSSTSGVMSCVTSLVPPLSR